MTFTFDELKLARERGYSDDEIWNTLSSEDKEIGLAKERGYSLEEVASITSGQPIPEGFAARPVEPEPERRAGGGVAGGAADIGVSFMKGLGTGTRMISDIFGANNPVSKTIAGYEDYMDSLLSSESKQDSEEISRILKDAEGKGILPQIMAGIEAFTVAPAEITASTVGMMLPNLAGGVAAKAAQLGKAGVIGLQAGIGAAQGAGSVKGQIYAAVQEELRQQGLPEDQIDNVATEAQAYGGKNLDQILIGAGLGAAAASTGAERIVTRLITGAGKGASEGLVKSVIKGGISEAPIEAFQGGQEKMAENIALQRIGVDVPTMRGVVPAAAMEATAGLLIGGAAGGVEAIVSPEKQEERDIETQADQGANELIAPNDAASQSVVKEIARQENAVKNLQQSYDVLEPTAPEAQKLKLELSEAQRNLNALKVDASRIGLSLPIPTAEQQQVELAKQIAAPVEPAPKAETREQIAERLKKQEEKKEAADIKKIKIDRMVQEDAVLDELLGIDPESNESFSLTRAEKEQRLTPQQRTEYGRRMLEFSAKRLEEVTAPAEPTPAPPSTPTPAKAPAPPVSETITPAVEAAPVTPAPAEAPAITPAPVAKTPTVTGAIVSPEQYVPSKNVRGGTTKQPLFTSLILQDGTAIVGESAHPLAWNRAIELGITTEDQLANSTSAFTRPDGFTETINGNQIPIKKIVWMDQFAEIQTAASQNNPINAAAVETYNISLPEGYTKQGDLYVYQPTPATPAAEPAGISVGNRIKLGKSPQTYTIEEVIPQSEAERGLGEQFYSVKNERTGEVQTVEAKDLKIVKPSKATRKMAPVRAEEEYTPVPEADRYTFKEAANRSIRFFGGTAPENFVIVNDSQNKDYEFKAGYDPDSGEIILNRAYIQKGENIEDILTHELGHYIYSDPQFQADFQNFLESLPEQDRAEIDEIVNEGYNKETNEVQIEERQVIAFASLVRKTKRGRTAWEKVKDTIKAIINRLLKTNIKLSDQGAMAVFNVGYKRFNSGERIIREMKKGTLRTAPEGMTQMDRDYLAAVERGDMETAQRMVDEAAKPPTHTLIDASKTQSDKIRWTDSANSQIEFYKSQIAKLPSVEEATREYEALVKAWSDAGLGQSVEDTIKGIIELKLQPPPSSLDEYLQTRIYLERKNAEAEIKKSQETLSRAPKGKTETEFKTGKPTVVKAYHSTPFGRLTEFSDEMLGRFTGAPSATKAHFFAGSPSVSETYFADDAWLLNHKGFFSLSAEQKKQLIESAREELPNGLDSTPDEIADLAMSLFDIDTYDTSPYENVRHDVYIRLNNPLVYDFKGAGYRDVSYNDLLVQAAEGGHDGVIMANTTDPGPASTLGSFPEPTNIIAVLRGHSSQIKSADPVTYDDAGNVIPLSQRFRPTSPDIRRMAPEPRKPAAEAKPTEEAAGRREKIMGEEVGPLIKTQDGIIAKTKEKLKTLFDPEKVNETNTSTAYRAIGILSGKNRDAAREYAESINALTAEGLGEDADAATEISMGAALFVNNLFEYAVKLAEKGDRKMLGLMVANINKLPTGQMGASDAGRTLRARVELKARFLLMAQAEQDAFTDYVAEYLFGPNPTPAQIKSIKDAYSATQKVSQPTAEELTEEIAGVGEKTGTDLVKKINDDFTSAAEKDAEARDQELDELSKEYNQVQNKAENEIEKLATIQSDTPSFVQRKKNEIRAIVSSDLKQRPDMGRKAPWKSLLVARLQNAGVSEANAETLADLVWRQHEINNLSRELESINKAIQKGPISEIINQIKDTPIEQQQDPKWRYQVMRDYLRRAGLSMAQAERIAKLMDISLQKRFTEAKEQAFTDAIQRSAPWKNGEIRSKRAFDQMIKAIRAGALDPSRNFISDIAAMNGWTGFTDDQYAKLLKLDSILANPKSSDADKAEAHKEVQNIISKAKLPIRARDIIGQFYDAQALSGIPTITVNMVSPIGMAAKNALVQAASGVATFRPEQVDAAFKTLIDSIKSWVKTVAYSFKNNVTVYSNVEYLVNDEGLLKLYNRGRDQFKNGKTPRDRADGVKNMMIGMWDYVRRILNALDYGAIASLQNQNVPKYALAAMQAKGMSSKDGAKMLNAMFEAKRNFYENQIAIGTDKNKASVLADEFFVSSWRQALTDAKLPAQEVMDAAINDAMSAVGRTRASLDGFRDENTKLQDSGVTSFPALWLLQTMANAANKSDSQIIKIFSRVIYGFAVVPARVFRETAWFSPYGYVRFAYDAIAKKKGLNSPYAQSLGGDLQYRQRLTEATAGTLVLLGLASALASSTDDEDDKRPFKIVVTGNGPNRADDPQYYDSWIKNNTPNTVTLKFGKVRIPINTMRGFEAFAWPAMMLGAVDDWKIRRKLQRKEKNPTELGDAAVVAGNLFSAALKRGPYAFAAKPLFEAYGDRTVESLFKSIAFPAKTLIPVIGSSILRNTSDFINDPIDRRTIDGALWANVPFIGPAVAPKALNAFGEPAMAGEAADKLFKLGVPIVFNIPNDRESVNLHELVLKKGGGPSIPTRTELARRLDRDPTNKEFQLFVKEYGSEISRVMKSRYKSLEAKKPEDYDAEVKKIGDRARDRAERIVKQKAKQP